MAEGGVIEVVVKAEVGDGTSIGYESTQQFALLFRVTQSNFISGWVYRMGDVSDVT